jgi:hypothetical protein
MMEDPSSWSRRLGKRVDAFLDWLRSLFPRERAEAAPSRSGSGLRLLPTLLMLGAGGLFVFLLWRLWRMHAPRAPEGADRRARFGAAARVAGLGPDFSIDGLDPWAEALRRRATDPGGAVVWLFLDQLLALERAGWIRLAPGKTARQYARSLSDPSLADGLSASLHAFEEISYGHRLPPPEALDAVWEKAEAVRRRLGALEAHGVESGPGPGVSRSVPLLAALCASALVSGCARGPETSYGSSRGDSINGTGVFVDLLRRRGHEVRTAWRLNDQLAGWADAIVRFAPTPGPPGRDEADWYLQWLESGTDRCLVYVVRDYDAEAEYWRLVAERLGDPADAERRAEAEARRERAASWVVRLPSRAEHPADPVTWFSTAAAVEPPAVCKTLRGPFAAGVDAGRAGLTVHAPLRQGAEEILLMGDDRPLALAWALDEGGRVLAVANGAFLLNLPLVNPERRLLAGRVADWIAGPRRVAVVEGVAPLGEPEAPPTLLDLVGRIDGFRWAAIQLGVLGLLACLARAPRLGRPRPEPPGDADRPAAHAEALGALLERSRSPATAREILDRYRSWRLVQPVQASAGPRGARSQGARG